jgi:hypothetical protein
VLLPIRIVKMPIDLMIYNALLPKILKIVRSVTNGEEEIEPSLP